MSLQRENGIGEIPTKVESKTNTQRKKVKQKGFFQFKEKTIQRREEKRERGEHKNEKE